MRDFNAPGTNEGGYSVREVAQQLGISEMRTRSLIREGVLHSDLRGRSRIIPATALSEYREYRATQAAALQANAPTDWDWEGNVVSALADHLSSVGWKVIERADTVTRAPGVDLRLLRDQTTLWVEVKGWPTATHSRGPKLGQTKRWRSTMARSYAGDLLLSALILRADHPNDLVAIAVPSHETFTTLLKRLVIPLRHVDIGAFVVHQDGSVDDIIALNHSAGGRVGT